MTNTPETEQALVTVTQEDIDALFQSGHPLSRDSKEAIEAGEWNHHHLLQAFARHREQAQRGNLPVTLATLYGYEAGFEEGKRQAQRTEPSAGDVERVALAVMAILWKAEQWNSVGPDYENYRIGQRHDMGGRVERHEARAREIATAAIQAMRGGQGERAGIVAWLRGQAAIYNDQNPNLSELPEWTLAQKWANAIERGDFLPGEDDR